MVPNETTASLKPKKLRAFTLMTDISRLLILVAMETTGRVVLAEGSVLSILLYKVTYKYVLVALHHFSERIVNEAQPS